jgi:hypothetical protein
MADVNGDNILDLIVGTGAGVDSQVVVYDGNDSAEGRFTSELARFAPFDAGFQGGVNVAGADIDGNSMADNIIVGSGPGIDSQVKVFSSKLPSEKDAAGNTQAPDVFSSFTPYPGSKSGVSIATGMVELGSGRESIVTAPGPGDAPQIKTFRFDLYTPTARAQANGTVAEHATKPNEPKMTSNFLAYDQNYTGGVSLTTGWVAGAEGGAKRIITGQLGGAGTVRVWSAGSRLDGYPGIYLLSPNHHDADIKFDQIASFEPFTGGAPTGVTVATTSTTDGADLLVSGKVANGAEVTKIGLTRPNPTATALAPTVVATLPAIPDVNGPAPLGGR